ncbi:MAG: hypothetical protein UT05_C0005G0024 [Parcubacteria group bacterium GW2011_GWF2_38_76]|nr:MAG: hypothetical protein UT05_C0005G0024 [Parcubacteria group bacterium GW2011_GWF2_38_76]HBM45594.1 hypothetical protein [Patescibacteria group bacterium]
MSGNTDLAKLISEVKDFLDELEKDKPKTVIEKKLLRISASLYLALIALYKIILRPGVIYVTNEFEELEELKKKLEKTKEEL